MLGLGWLAAVRAFFTTAAGQTAIVASAAPSITSIVAVVLLGIGGFAGFKVGAWWTASSVRSEVNAEWRTKIANANPAVKAIVAAANEEGDAIDAEVIKEIGDTYANFKNASSQLATARKSPIVSRCSVPADCLQ